MATPGAGSSNSRTPAFAGYYLDDEEPAGWDAEETLREDI